jgi:hypothetical protein
VFRGTPLSFAYGEDEVTIFHCARRSRGEDTGSAEDIWNASGGVGGTLSGGGFPRQQQAVRWPLRSRALGLCSWSLCTRMGDLASRWDGYYCTGDHPQSTSPRDWATSASRQPAAACMEVMQASCQRSQQHAQNVPCWINVLRSKRHDELLPAAGCGDMKRVRHPRRMQVKSGVGQADCEKDGWTRTGNSLVLHSTVLLSDHLGGGHGGGDCGAAGKRCAGCCRGETAASTTHPCCELVAKGSRYHHHHHRQS